MQQPNSQTTDNPLESQWEGIFNPYEDYPLMALTLAQNFQAIKDTLETGPRGTIHVIQSMDEAIETLFPFSEFYNAGFELFLLATQGKLPAAFDLRRFAEQARSETESW